MITFENIPYDKDKQYVFLIPDALKGSVTAYLRRAQIPYQSLNWGKLITVPRDPYSIKPELKEAVEQTRKNFEEHGYDKTTCIGAIISGIDPATLWERCLLFFGPTMDEDYKQECDEAEQRAREAYEKYYEKWLPEGCIPIAAE